MAWEKEIEGLLARRSAARLQGGEQAVARQHERGRLTARERIDALLDPGSLREEGRITGHGVDDGGGRLASFEAANVVLGLGRIDGRPVVVCADDFTVAGATYSAVGIKKGIYADQLATQRRVPLVRLLEGGGAKISGALGAPNRSGYDMTEVSASNLWMARALREVPVVCAALGPVAGGPAARLVTSHLSIMTRRSAQVMIGGPILVERATGIAIDKEQLGGADVHLRSGVVDNVAEDEAGVWQQARAFLSYLPSHTRQLPPLVDRGDPRDRRDASLRSAIPEQQRRAYKIRPVLETIFDRGSFFELSPLYGRSTVTGLARLNGDSVGVFANDPVHAGGAMTAQSARKVRRLIELCDQFHLPIVTLVDQPGFLIGPEGEKSATLRFGVETLFAAMDSRVPWASVILRRSFGVAAGIHMGPGAMTFAWPSARFGALPIEGGVALAYRKEIQAAADPEQRRREIEDEVAQAQSVFPRAEEFGVHEVIDPIETRPALCDWLENARFQRDAAFESGPIAYRMRP